MISYVLFRLLVIVLKYLLKTRNDIILGITESPQDNITYYPD